ncbi:MAG: GNAT family N-acetyltransferase [Pseudomonadota bacterium]
MIREITPADIPALFVVRPQTRENAMTVDELAAIGVTPATIGTAIAGPQKGWLFEQAGEVGGFAMGDASQAELTVMAMLPHFEGQGIGGRLLTQVEGWLAEEGCSRIWLTTDINPQLRAYGFYLHHGWQDWKIAGGLRYMAKDLTGI